MRGLTQEQVAERVAQGLTNDYRPPSSRSVSSILRENIFTLFNAILLTALVFILLFGSPKDGLFGFVMVANAATGIISELRAKRTLDRLAILDTADVTALRDGHHVTIAPADIVQDDVLLLKAGDQVPADGHIDSTEHCQIDESILTGESLPLHKKAGDTVLSGSTVVVGQAYVCMTTVGRRSYANQMSQKVKTFDMAHSELEEGVNAILRIILFILPIVIAALMASQIHQLGGFDVVAAENKWSRVVVACVSGVVAMVPQGLVLLTSVNFASAALVLALRHRVLVQELPAVEVLARVDTLCLDKTGTITSGEIQALGCAALDSDGKVEGAQKALQAPREILSDEDLSALALLAGDKTNKTAEAVADMCPADADALNNAHVVPFSSARKWAMARRGQTCWVMGAPDIIAASMQAPEVISSAQIFADDGMRVLLLAKASQVDMENAGDCSTAAHRTDRGQDAVLPPGLQCVCLIVLAEEIRVDAPQTLAYLKEQGLDVKVISGDNPRTVGAIAARAGLSDAPRICDAATLDSAAMNAKLMDSYDVFGRVSPEQKSAMVDILQRDGKTVAMTGDGVNDALALKNADLGIAMGSGAQATKAAAKVVLLDSQFSALPAVLSQGRRVLGNMERVSTLFFTKTVYAVTVAAVVALTLSPYPYLPRHLTLIGTLTIGIPAFFLAMAPSERVYRPGFLRRTLSLSIPVGLIAGSGSLWTYWQFAGDAASRSTAATLSLAAISLIMLGIMSRPLLSWRAILLALMGAGLVAAVVVPVVRGFFALAVPSPHLLATVLGTVAVASVAIIAIGVWWTRRFYPSKH